MNDNDNIIIVIIVIIIIIINPINQSRREKSTRVVKRALKRLWPMHGLEFWLREKMRWDRLATNKWRLSIDSPNPIFYLEY